MPSTPPAAIPQTYAELLRGVKRVLLSGQQDIERAWALTYHETGRLICVHILLHQDRADYGARVYQQLARDTGASERKLYECAQVYRRMPILRLVAELGWNRSRLVAQIEDDAARKNLARQATSNGWTSAELTQRVRTFNAAAETAAEPAGPNGANRGTETKYTGSLIAPKRGIAGRYRVRAQDDALWIDVGFKLYLPLPPAQTRHRTAGEIVHVDADGSIRAVGDGKSTDLFTYRASIHRVIDGDTLEIAVTLPHFVMREKLRLRALDCPEMDTADGRTAKRVVEALVAQSEEVTIVTSKVDKYDRYLADVFLRLHSGEDVFLNNHLLTHGHAGQMNASAQDDWLP